MTHDAARIILRIFAQSPTDTLSQGVISRKIRGRCSSADMLDALGVMLDAGALTVTKVETSGRLRRDYTLVNPDYQPAPLPAVAPRPALAKSNDFALVTALRANEAALRDVNETLRAILNRLP